MQYEILSRPNFCTYHPSYKYFIFKNYFTNWYLPTIEIKYEVSWSLFLTDQHTPSTNQLTTAIQSYDNVDEFLRYSLMLQQLPDEFSIKAVESLHQ